MSSPVAVEGERAGHAQIGRVSCALSCQPSLALVNPNRFCVLPTGRTVFAWGVWDSERFPLNSIAQLAPRNEDWVSRHRDRGLAYAKARQMNRMYGQRRAA
jgi:hypothetical protein